MTEIVNKNTKNYGRHFKVKWIAAAAALILLGVLAFAFKNNSEGTAGAKQITIHVKGVKHQETISIDSDCETLAELLKTHTELKAEVDNGPYGAYLITLLDETQDMNPTITRFVPQWNIVRHWIRLRSRTKTNSLFL